MENTVRLKAASDEKSVLAGSEFHTVKILHGKHFHNVIPVRNLRHCRTHRHRCSVEFVAIQDY